MTTSNDPNLMVATPPGYSVAQVVYALHTLAIVIGIAGSPTVVGSFVGSVPSIIAVILNYLNRLGDLLFVLARASNAQSGANDQVWESGR